VRLALPRRARLAAEAERAGRGEREPNHLAELRLVLVPADRRARRVLGQERLLERFGLHAGEAGGRFPRRQQKIRDVCDGTQILRAVIVFPAIGDDAALAEEAVELELLERQVLEAFHQGRFVVLGQDASLVAESFRQRFRRVK